MFSPAALRRVQRAACAEILIVMFLRRIRYYTDFVRPPRSRPAIVFNSCSAFDATLVFSCMMKISATGKGGIAAPAASAEIFRLRVIFTLPPGVRKGWAPQARAMQVELCAGRQATGRKTSRR